MPCYPFFSSATLKAQRRPWRRLPQRCGERPRRAAAARRAPRRRVGKRKSDEGVRQTGGPRVRKPTGLCQQHSHTYPRGRAKARRLGAGGGPRAAAQPMPATPPPHGFRLKRRSRSAAEACAARAGAARPTNSKGPSRQGAPLLLRRHRSRGHPPAGHLPANGACKRPA